MIFLAIAAVFGGGGGPGDSLPKDVGWLDRLANALKRLAGKSVKPLKLLQYVFLVKF